LSGLKEDSHARNATGGLERDAKLSASLALGHLWQALLPADRRALLEALSQIVVKQTQTPLRAKEVAYENC
jgi:hypothetical protein